MWFPVLWGALLWGYRTSGSASDWKVHQSITIQGRAKQELAYTETAWRKQQHLDRADIASKQNANWLVGVERRHTNAPAVLSLQQYWACFRHASSQLLVWFWTLSYHEKTSSWWTSALVMMAHRLRAWSIQPLKQELENACQESERSKHLNSVFLLLIQSGTSAHGTVQAHI